MTPTFEEQFAKASKIGDLALIKDLVSQGADIHFNDNWIFYDFCSFGHLDCVKYFVEYHLEKYNNTTTSKHGLNWACSMGQLPIIKYLLDECGIEGNLNNAFIEACTYKQFDTIQYLIEKGVNPHENNHFVFLNTIPDDFKVISYFIFTLHISLTEDIKAVLEHDADKETIYKMFQMRDLNQKIISELNNRTDRPIKHSKTKL